MSVALFVSARGQQQDSISAQIDMQSVIVTGDSRIIKNTGTNGNFSIGVDALHALPHFAGATDVMKILQFMPGVSASTDGDAGLYVRGGDAGQNRTILNGAPIYSPSHLFGFFSVFNTAHLGSLTLLKSNIPASYGSALSSITDIRTHSHIPARTSIEGNIGIIESDLALQIPAAEKSAIYLSARHSYTSWLLAFLNKDQTSLSYEFGDYGLTIVQDVGRAGRLIVNSHFNHDKAKMKLGQYDSQGDLKWWDSSSSAILKSRIRDNIEMENTIYAVWYDNELDIDMTGNDVKSPSALCDIGARSITTLFWEKLTLMAGMDYAMRGVQPQAMYSSIAPQMKKTGKQNTHEAALFFSAEYSPSKTVGLNAGLRASIYSAGSSLFAYPEPRVMLTVTPNTNYRLWASYNMSVQYLQLVPESNVSFATDFYVSSSDRNPPQVSHNISVGYGQSSADRHFDWSAEAFYRRMKNVIEYDTRLSTMIGGSFDMYDFLYSGQGESYGLEVSLGYTHRLLDIHASYTLSRSLRRFDEINDGKAFAAKSDRTHNLSLIAVINPSDRWTLSATFLYATGGAYTAPTAIYMSGGSILKEYGPYNGNRLPDFNRLDLSATYWISKNGLRKNGINLSIYNVYARKNPLTVSWAVFRDHDNPSVFHISQRRHALYTVVPSISWTFRF